MTSTKTILLILISFLFLLSIDCSSSKKIKEPGVTKWIYFQIYADADDAPIFVKLQDDLGINPKLERYSIVVDKRDKDPNNWYVLFGDEASSSPPRFSWSKLSKDVQDGLVNWTGSNKENLQ
jgi:type II restriction/modification system DNA methylase subunit YeeA